MSFGPSSNNPRERRAYAHTKLSQLKRGEANYEEVFEAISAASHNRKGQTSGFVETLGKTAVLLVDWGATTFRRPGIVHHNFGGYVMPYEETIPWTTLRQAIDAKRPKLGDSVSHIDGPDDPELRKLHSEHNKVHTRAYPKAQFSRIYRGIYSVNDGETPKPGTVVNPAELADVTSFISWNDDQTVEAHIAQLQ